MATGSTQLPFAHAVSKTTPFVWPLVSASAARYVRLTHAHVALRWTLSVNMRCRARNTAARVQRHARINDLIHRALIRADMPATKEPLDLSRKDGTRMWANAQRDGRPDEHRWSALFNAAKFG